MSRILLIILLSLFSLFAGAQERYQAETLEEVQAQARLLKELRQSASISQDSYDKENQRLKERAYELTHGQFPKELTEAENIVQTQRFDWLSTGLMVVSALIGLAVFFPLLKKLYFKFRFYLVLLRRFIRRYFLWLPKLLDFVLKHLGRLVKKLVEAYRKVLEWLRNAPHIVQELVAYSISISLLFWLESIYFLIPVMLLMTVYLSQSIDRYVCKFKSKHFANAFLLAASIFWSICAFYFESSIIGFIAVGFINAFLGFSIGIYPGWVEFGFARHTQSYIFRTSLISLAMLLTGWLVFYSHLLPNTIGMQVYMFSAGLYFFVPLTFYVGILVISGMWFEDKKYYFGYNVYAVLSGFSVLLLAYLYSMGFLFWIGAIFMVWFVSSKYYEIIWKRYDVVYAATGVAIALGGSGYYIQNNLPEIVRFMTPIL